MQITAVCNFFTYIRYIQQGLVRQDGKSWLQWRQTGRNWEELFGVTGVGPAGGVCEKQIKDKRKHEGRSGVSVPCLSSSWELCSGVELVRGDLVDLSCLPPLWECWEHSRAGAGGQLCPPYRFFGGFFSLLCPCCALQWSQCTGRSCGSGGRCLWPNLDFIPARCKQSPEPGRKLLLEEGLGVQCLSCSLPPSLCLEQGARGTSPTFSCPTPPSVTGMQLPRCPWSWAGPGCSRNGHPWTLESPICRVYPCFF